MKARDLALASLLLGCASDPTPEERLAGTWAYEESGGCVRAFDFDGERFAFLRACALQGGGFGVERDEGTFSANGSELDISVARSSCSDRGPRVLIGYELGDDWLAIDSADGATRTVYERADESSGDDGMIGAQATFGCWRGETLEPHAVEAL